jgi:seryl-tRNA synthetase
MIDIKMVINDREKLLESLNKRQFKDIQVIDEITDLYEKRSLLQREVEALNAKRNEASAKFTSCTPDQREEIKKEVRTISDKIKDISPELDSLKANLENLLLYIPNVIREDVPLGKDDSDNPVIKEWKAVPKFDFQPKEHFDLPIKGIDLETGAKLSGSRFVLYSHKVARLLRALTNLMLDTHAKNGYQEIIPPILVKRETMQATGQLPKFEAEAYKTTDDLFLIPTSEVSLVNIHRDEILLEDQLPIYYTAFTPCFRKESGSYGKDTKGVIRMHQFNKVELVKFVKPEDDNAELDKLVADVEGLLQLLDIPYRIVVQSTGDMGFTSHITYDLEVWFPGQNRYREISSVSTTKDFQSRRGNIRFRRKESNKVDFLHTLNGSGLGMDRAVASILENYQQSDGSVKVPKALIPYCGFDTIEAGK